MMEKGRIEMIIQELKEKNIAPIFLRWLYFLRINKKGFLKLTSPREGSILISFNY